MSNPYGKRKTSQLGTGLHTRKGIAIFLACSDCLSGCLAVVAALADGTEVAVVIGAALGDAADVVDLGSCGTAGAGMEIAGEDA